jgi:2-C-methyl-D-erythritol 4-phosphate cytidylyltransferase
MIERTVPCKMKVGVIIVCAGRGVRLKKGDKATLSLAGKPLFYQAFNIFKNIKEIGQIALVLRKKNFSLAKNLIDDKRVILVEGGLKRKDSVYNGLRALNKNISHVLVHDGARPFACEQLIYRLIGALKKNDAVICAVSSKDALKLIENNKVKSTLAREKIVCVQTPQGFRKSLLLRAYSSLGAKDAVDDAWAVELWVMRLR